MIGILTFHWADDYGAMLQAYALKTYIKGLDRGEVEVLPYAPVKLAGRYWLFPVTGIEMNRKIVYFFGAWGFVKNVSHMYAYLKRRKSMRNFRQRYLTSKAEVRKAGRLSLKKYSYVFVGSDQVWNPDITVGLDRAYMGNIREKGNCRLVAYGASFGKDSLPAQYHAEFKRAVNKNFIGIAMREKSAVPFVKSFFHGYVTDVLDPTLLLEARDWKKIGKKPKQKDYILYIYTEYNARMVQYLHKLSAELKKKVIQVTVPWPGQGKKWINLEIEGGPSEFIGFIQNADYIVTNSFHGMVFSILLEKKFLVFGHSDRNARIANLMEKLDLRSRLIEKERMCSKEEIMQDIDWEHVRSCIEKERRRSMEFIENMLGSA
ncbi:polysaccharide pyruvyl transferase family protein [Lachnospiraceae bacterium 56-18]